MLAVNLTPGALLELVVMAFQMTGVAALCLSRLMPATRWGGRGRVALILSLLGLGISGALCGHHDSEFGLFAGGTMTVLLMGMIMGGGAAPRAELGPPITAEANLAG
jgi:hypothetical protein